MKKVGLAFALLAVCGAAVAANDEPLEVVAVHEVVGRSQAQLCSDARDWVALKFRDSKAVVEVFDAERGRLIGKGSVKLLGYASAPFLIGFTLQVDCKDGRFRSTFSNFTNTSAYGTFDLKEDKLNKLKTQAEARVKDLDNDLVQHLSKPGKSADW